MQLSEYSLFYRRRSRRPVTERKVFNPRKVDEVNSVVEYESQQVMFDVPTRNWLQYVHPRAREYFMSHDALVDALRLIAKNINKDEDPILV
jgi:hypothetical protein